MSSGNLRDVKPSSIEASSGSDVYIYGMVSADIDGHPFSMNLLRFDDNGIIKDQTHSQWHSIYVIEGECVIKIGDSTQEFCPGGYAYIPPEVPHSFACKSGSARVLICKM